MTMLADNVEHVISYWAMYQKFNSPALAGFAVVSHWVPFLLFSAYAGALADRFDPRRLIQVGMGMFIAASLGWAWFIHTDTLEVWHAMVLLTLHGFAGVLWAPASQLLLHDIVSPALLPSAVRLNATGRWLGLLLGPGVGAGLLLALGPAPALAVNVLIYLPLTLWLINAPYGPKFRPAGTTTPRAMRGLGDVLRTAAEVARHPIIMPMTLLAGGASFFVGGAYHAQMPGFARELGHGDPGLAYGSLLAADAAGALIAGFVLEGRGLLKADPKSAIALAVLWALSLTAFALSHSFMWSLLLLFAAGFFELSFNAMAQTLVQLNAPADIRGRVIGLYSTAALGLRAFSGVTVGILGAAIGIHWSLAASALALTAFILVLAAFALPPRRA